MTPIFNVFARYPRPIAIKIMRDSDFQAQLFKLSYALALSGFCLLGPTATYSQSLEAPEFSVPTRARIKGVSALEPKCRSGWQNHSKSYSDSNISLLKVEKRR